MAARPYPAVLLALFVVSAGLSAWHPSDWINWVSETFPAWIGAGILAATWKRFPLTNVAYTLVFVFALILLTGGHYTYAAVPMGEWWKDWFGWERNHFDRMGHYFQGVIPAILARELLLRRTSLRPGTRMLFLCGAAALAISALYVAIPPSLRAARGFSGVPASHRHRDSPFGCGLRPRWEIFEWQYAVAFGGDAASDFLGSQGDVWDAQKDMTAALLGALSSQLVLARLHDRQIAAVRARIAA